MVSGVEENIMIYILWSFFLFLSLFSSVIYPPIFSIGSLVRIDIMIVALSLFTLYLSPYFVFPAFFLSGLIIDSFFNTPMGYHSLIYLIIAFAIYSVKGYIFKEKFMFQIMVISASTFLYRIIDTCFYASKYQSFNFIIINTVVSPIASILFYSLIYALIKVILNAVKRYAKFKPSI